MTRQRWSALDQHRLSRARRAGIIELRYPGDLRGTVDELVAAESDCCGHVSWEARPDGDDVLVKIRGTDDDLDAFD